MNKISLCLTTFNRPDITLQSFANVLHDERIGEIVINDDFSTPENYKKLIDNVLKLNNTKIKVYRNSQNMGVFDNKKISVSRAKYPYVIVFDSDNVLPVIYLDLIYSIKWEENLILAPTFAKPEFDYRAFNDCVIHKGNVSEFIDRDMFAVFINTMNYFVHRDTYLNCWEPRPDIIGADSIYMNYLWMKNGGRIFAVKGLEYDHLVHAGSHYIQNAIESTPKCEWVRGLMRDFPKSDDVPMNITYIQRIDIQDSKPESKPEIKPKPAIVEYVYRDLFTVLSEICKEKGINPVGGDTSASLRNQLNRVMTESALHTEINKRMTVAVEQVSVIKEYVTESKPTNKGFVTAKLSGRLANQFFIHAAAKALALKHGVEYLAHPKDDTKYEPNYFKDCFPQLSNQKIESEYNEKREQYFDEIPFTPNMCLVGYFQSRFYWWDYREQILPMFGIKPVVKMDTISIHIRKGDFKDLTKKHHIISDEYLRSAIKHYINRGYEKFEIFSDEIELCKPFFKSDEFKELTFVFSEGRTPIEDMAEMSGCAHQICSASSYSYMACYLNTNPNKTHILPNELWGETHLYLQSEESYPPNSIRMDNNGKITKI